MATLFTQLSVSWNFAPAAFLCNLRSSTVYTYTAAILMFRFYFGSPLCSEVQIVMNANSSGFCHCTSLLDIFCYNLNAIPTFTSTEPTRVTYRGLYAQRQHIRGVSSQAFGSLKLESIVLNYNPLVDLISPTAFVGLEWSLRDLRMGGCQIAVLPDGLLNGLEELRYLHLWGNRIIRIPRGFFKEAGNLRELLLWGNLITVLDEYSFAGLWNLKKLDLDRNRLSSLHKDIFRHLIELESLHVGENTINALFGETFSHMENLRVLNLDRSRIKFVYSKAFDGLQRLVSLKLNDNFINFIPDDVFLSLRNLTNLWLNNNTIEYVWRTSFSGLPSLERLYLSDNRLTTLPDGALRQSSNLRHVFLDNNRLQSLRKCVLPVRVRLKIMSLFGNHMTCNCRLAWLADLQRLDGLVTWGGCYGEESILRSSPPYDVIDSFHNIRACPLTTLDCQNDT